MPICPKCREKNPALGAKCPRDGFYYVYESALEDAETDPRIGTLAAEKYVILGLISEGGMGAVYRALQLPVEREVALKVLRTELQDSNKGRERFIQEARAISRLSHPNIITLHDFGFERETHPYMVMEFAPGVELTRWMWGRNMTAERLLHVGRQILSALAEAHRRDIVHRDLKPENVIITTTGHDGDFPKLLDFGIARLINEGSTRGLTREGEVFGTPHYMSPEQAQGKREIGPQADVYAMGVMFYELFTGEPPFDAEAPLSVLFMHINDPMPTLIPRAGIKAPDWLDGFITQATRKDPANRYQDAGEMLTALDRLMSGEAPEARNAAPEPTTEERATASAPTDPLIAAPADHAAADTDPEPPESAPQAGPVIDDPMVAASDSAPTDPDVPPAAHASANTVFLGDDLQKEGAQPQRRGLYAALAILILLLLVGGVFMMSRPAATPTTDTPVALAEPSSSSPEAESAPVEAPEAPVEEAPEAPVAPLEVAGPEASPEAPVEVDTQEAAPVEEPPTEAARATPEPENAPAEAPTRTRETTAEREAEAPAEAREDDEGPTKFKSPDSVPRKFGRPPTATN